MAFNTAPCPPKRIEHLFYRYFLDYKMWLLKVIKRTNIGGGEGGGGQNKERMKSAAALADNFMLRGSLAESASLMGGMYL